MPTPAVHLSLAERMLRREDLSLRALRLLRRQRSSFLLGHTAPDVRTVSGQRREECHFYTVPRTSSCPAHQALFDAHPSLCRVVALSPAHIAFVAGYVAHLLLDELWLEDVFHRFLLREWASLRERLFLHNVLRTWMDYRAQEALDSTVAADLRDAKPQGWLPFVDDEHLGVWRDWLVDQLAPNHRMETAEVLAGRMGVRAVEIETVVQSRELMEDQVFRHFPRSALESFREKGYQRSVILVDRYINGLACRTADHAEVDLTVYESTDLARREEASP